MARRRAAGLATHAGPDLGPQVVPRLPDGLAGIGHCAGIRIPLSVGHKDCSVVQNDRPDYSRMPHLDESVLVQSAHKVWG